MVYRILLKRKGGSFYAGMVSAAWVNTTLKSEREWQEAAQKIRTAGLYAHPDSQKNWDALAALDFILNQTNKEASGT